MKNLNQQNIQAHINERFDLIDGRLDHYSETLENGTHIAGEYDIKIKIERELSARGELAMICSQFKLKYKPLKETQYVTNQRGVNALQREE